MTDRILGALGILGGAVLLAAFVVPIPGPVNTLRLCLFILGAIAVVIAVQRRQAPAGSRLTLAVAAATVLANAAYLLMVVLSVGRPMPPEPDPGFRLVMFYAGLAMWLTDSAFGFVSLRLGAIARWGALALAVGSLLAILGMSHLELTSPTNPTVLGQLALAGVASNGIGWILLGAWVARVGGPTRATAPTTSTI
jgi:hypothetical protein